MAIKLNNLKKSFGGKAVLDIPSLALPEKGIFGVFGASGSGKTTLLRLLCGLEKATGGSIDGLSGKKIACVFQEDRLLQGRTALQNVADASDEESARLWLGRMGLAGDADKTPSMLSGGMCRRVALARAFAFGGDVYLLDEPFKGLDGELKNEIIALVESIAKDALVILVTHDAQGIQLAQSSITL